MEVKESVRKLQDFIHKEYINNPEMDSTNWGIAIMDVLTDMIHLGEMFDVNIDIRLKDAQDVYEQELTQEL